jgi:signal transduction histidine kinase
VLGDAGSLRSVFTNLIINSLHAFNNSGGALTITLLAHPEENIAQIDVSDTGKGIPAEDIPKLFEPYFSTKETGTGLGLAIVKKAVEDHGGTIAVKSTPGEGTTFSITLPLGRKE